MTAILFFLKEQRGGPNPHPVLLSAPRGEQRAQDVGQGWVLGRPCAHIWFLGGTARPLKLLKLVPPRGMAEDGICSFSKALFP